MSSHDQVLRLHLKGRVPREIGKALGCSLGTVYRLLKAAGVTPHRVPVGSKPHLARPDIDDARLVQLRKEGLSIPEVAAACHCTEGLVKWRLRRIGATSVKLRKQYRKDVTVKAVVRAYESGMLVEEMLLKFRCSFTTIRARLKEGGVTLRKEGEGGTGRPQWRPDVTVEAVAALYRKGWTVLEIANQFKCTDTTVSNRLKTLGIKPDPYRRAGGTKAFRQDVTRARVRAATASGQSPRDIAQALGCSVDTVHSRLNTNVALHRADVPVEDVVEAWRQGASLIELARRFQCTVKTIRRRLQRAGLPFARLADVQEHPTHSKRRPYREDVTVELIQAGLKRGLNVEEVAAELGCSAHLIVDRLRAVGFEPPPLKRRTYNTHVSMEAVRTAHDQGLSTEEIAIQLGCSTATVIRRLRDSRKVSPERPSNAAASNSLAGEELTAEKALVAFGAGVSAKIIARMYGVSEGHVYVLLRGT